MFNEIKKWLSDKNNEITDKIDGLSNRDNNNSISLNNDLLQMSDLKIFHSNQNIIKSLVGNEINVNSILNQNNNVIKWLNSIKLRKQFLEQLNSLCVKSSKVLELLETISSKTTLKVSRIRTENLLKVLKYAANNDIFNYSDETGFRNMKHSIIKVSDSQSFLLKVMNSLIPSLVRGNPIVMIAEHNIAMFVSFFVDLCESAGLMSGIIQFIITDSNLIDKLQETAKESNPSLFAIFESADVESSIERITTSFINDSLESINVLVQQSLYKKFCQRMKTRLLNMFVIGDQFNPMSDIISEIVVNYEAIDVEKANESFGIKVYQFRTNEEAKLLINHYIEIPYISLWAEKASLALEFARSINSSDNIYINSTLSYPLKKESSVLKYVIDSVEVSSLSGNKNNQTKFESMLVSQTKWKTTEEEERKRIINHFLINNDYSLLENESVLQQFNHRISESICSSGVQLVLSHFEPIGLIVIRIDDKTDNKRTLSIVLEALLLGNCVIISGAKDANELSKLSDYLSSLGKNILHLMTELSYGEKGNSIITFSHKNVGLYFDDISVSNKLMKRLKRSITLSIGDINYAK